MSKPRKPKPVNYGKRRALRLGKAEEAAVAAMRDALARIRGVKAEAIPFSEALRILLVENTKAARAMAGQPETLPSAATIDLPNEFWDDLTECRNRLSHSQGSLYRIMKTLHFDDGTVTRQEVRDAFEAVQDSKRAIAGLVERAEAFLDDALAGAGAKAEAG